MALFCARHFGRFHGGNRRSFVKLPRAFPLAAELQLPGLGGRRARLQHRHLDAARRPGLARAHPAHAHNASAVGIVMALQFGPQLLLLPWTGFAADHFNQRKLLIATQATMGALALVLGLLTVTGARAALARLRVRLPVRLRGGVRCAGAPDVRGRAGRRGRPLQRDRAELDLVQRRADDRTRGRRARSSPRSAPDGPS